MSAGLPTALLRTALVMALTTACHARANERDELAPEASRFPHNAQLFSVLAAPAGMAQLDSLAQLERRTGWQIADTLTRIIEDTTLHPHLRANAVWLLGKMHAILPVAELQPLLADPDERIRLATVAAAREQLSHMPESALAVLRFALNDPSPAVQARVLEAITDRDIDLLREWLQRRPAPQLIPIAQDLIAAAEERGAPLQPDSSGFLRRRGPAGHELVFRPLKQWPSWQISSGELELHTTQGTTMLLGGDVEVVRGVLPAFFSGDGRFLVYEKERQIFVRDVTAGTEHSRGTGIAPRPIPFTEDFVFAREIQGARNSGSRLQYMLVRQSFASPAADSTAEIIGNLTVSARLDVSGAASPVRWMRVQENADGTGFVLAGQGFDPVPLPGPIRLNERVR